MTDLKKVQEFIFKILANPKGKIYDIRFKSRKRRGGDFIYNNKTNRFESISVIFPNDFIDIECAAGWVINGIMDIMNN